MLTRSAGKTLSKKSRIMANKRDPTDPAKCFTMITVSFSNSTQQALECHLAAAIQLNNVPLYRKVHALLLMGEGEAFCHISESLRLSVESVYLWFRKLSAQGLAWLQRYHYPGRGRKPKLTQAKKDDLYDRIVVGPQANGFDGGLWNTAMIADEVSFAMWGSLART